MLSYHKILLSFYIYLYTSMVRLAPMLLFLCILYSIGNHMAPHIPSPSPLIVDDLYCEPTLNLTLLDALNIFPIGCLLFLPIIVLLFHHCEIFRFVCFSTNLSLQTKRSKQAVFPYSSLLILNLQIILLNENKESWSSLLIITRDINFSFSFETTRHTINHPKHHDTFLSCFPEQLSLFHKTHSMLASFSTYNPFSRCPPKSRPNGEFLIYIHVLEPKLDVQR